MRTIVKGKNFEVTDRVRRYAERRFKRIERLLYTMPVGPERRMFPLGQFAPEIARRMKA